MRNLISNIVKCRYTVFMFYLDLNHCTIIYGEKFCLFLSSFFVYLFF